MQLHQQEGQSRSERDAGDSAVKHTSISMQLRSSSAEPGTTRPIVAPLLNGLKRAPANNTQPVDASYPLAMRPEVPPQITHSHAYALRPHRGALHGCAHLALMGVVGMDTV
jgi:hypothetical protein